MLFFPVISFWKGFLDQWDAWIVFSTSVNQVLIIGSRTHQFLPDLYLFLVFLKCLQHPEWADTWNIKLVNGSAAISWFLRLSFLLINQMFPLSSTCGMDIGRAEIGIPVLMLVQKKQLSAFSASSLSFSVAFLQAKSLIFSYWPLLLLPSCDVFVILFFL